jgi:hypothetical protein
MKELKDIVSESLLDDEDDIMNAGMDVIRENIKKWIFENYLVIKSSVRVLKKPNKDGKFIVNADHAIFKYNSKSDHLTNGLFVWGAIKNQFVCKGSNIISLEGAPKKVNGNFDCSECEKLTSLEGAPEEVNGNFSCWWCSKITSLKGAPGIVNGDFICCSCDSLKTLEGAPKIVGKDFSCSSCDSLKTLKGSPEIINGDYWCTDCGSLKSFSGAPETIRGKFHCYRCKSLTITTKDQPTVGGAEWIG